MCQRRPASKSSGAGAAPLLAALARRAALPPERGRRAAWTPPSGLLTWPLAAAWRMAPGAWARFPAAEPQHAATGLPLLS